MSLYMTEKVILAFSGGLDTSIAIKWIEEKYDLSVVTVTVDVGQNDDYESLEKRAYEIGSHKHYNVDAKNEFVNIYVNQAIKSNAMYQGKYPLATALARPLIASKLVEIAKKENSKLISHGCTGKGNDQARFDISIKSLYPEAKIIAPVREWNLSRTQEIEYAKKHKISTESTSEYSIDLNLWGRSIEGGKLEDLTFEAPESILSWIKLSNKETTSKYMEIEFQNGIPVKVDLETDSIKILDYINNIAGSYGVGLVDHIEDRLVGLKSREIYEAPAAITLIESHKDLEKLVLTRNELEIKSFLEQKWAWLVYNGLFYDPSLESINKFVDSTQKRVNGKIKVKFYNGNFRVVERSSDNSIYDKNIVSFDTDAFDQRQAEGFTSIWGMQSKINEGDSQ